MKRSCRRLGPRHNKEIFVNNSENQRPKSIRKEKCQRPRGKCRLIQRNALFRMFSLRRHFRWQIDAFCAILEWSLLGHWRFETGNQKCCWYLPLQKPLGWSHLIFLDVDLNLRGLQRGNLLMTTAVLTLRSSIALWMFDYPANGMNLQNLANWGLPALFCWGCKTSVVGAFHQLIYTTANFECFCGHLTELQNSLACWRLAALIYLFSEQNGCWLLLRFFECLWIFSYWCLHVPYFAVFTTTAMSNG